MYLALVCKSSPFPLPLSRLSADMKSIELDTKFENPTGDESDTTAAEYDKFANYLLSVEEDRDCRYACYDVR